MKKLMHKLILLTTIFVLGCEGETTDDVSRITYFTDIELIGEETTLIPVGTAYNEQGVIAFEGENDVTDTVVISGNVDSSTPGLYSVSYSAVNSDGFEKIVQRTVIVHPTQDSSVDYSGTYIGEARGETMTPGCNITKIAPSTYVADDFFGGVYCCGFRNYGLAYRLKTYFYISDDNTSYTNMENTSPWGPWQILNTSISGTTLSHTVEQGGFSFDVKLIKQ